MLKIQYLFHYTFPFFVLLSLTHNFYNSITYHCSFYSKKNLMLPEIFYLQSSIFSGYHVTMDLIYNEANLSKCSTWSYLCCLLYGCVKLSLRTRPASAFDVTSKNYHCKLQEWLRYSVLRKEVKRCANEFIEREKKVLRTTAGFYTLRRWLVWLGYYENSITW